jgi:hypothetical protein
MEQDHLVRNPEPAGELVWGLVVVEEEEWEARALGLEENVCVLPVVQKLNIK